MKYPKTVHSFEVVAQLPANLTSLKKLANNLYWSWSAPIFNLFREMDRQLWQEVEHNPTQLLERISPEKLARLASDDGFLANLKLCEDVLARYQHAESWWSQRGRATQDNQVVAYFCAEFGITEALPIYSGGLGVLAGDHLKAASDLGLPFVGVGLLYSRGYFRQTLTPDGWQQEHYPQYDFYKMPLQLARGEDMNPVRVEIEMPDRTITCQVWTAQVGRCQLVLLDSNVLENAPTDQGITDTLYGGDQEMRIRQEIILGIGGMRALQKLGLRPVVCHMNEGHAAFLTIERIRQVMQEYGCDYRTARKVVVSSNIFTTHTPVPAGFDLFPNELLQRYLPKQIEGIGLTFEEFVKLGRMEPENEAESFNMAVFAMENANSVNGVSKLHAQVTRGMFQARWPGYAENEVPVSPVTNGIHSETWVNPAMGELLDQSMGTKWRTAGYDPDSWSGVWAIPDEDLWELREHLRADLVRFARRRLKKQRQAKGFSQSDIAAVDHVLDPRILTIGFARRFATYKRATLMLSDRDRLRALLNHSERPVQFVLAGKSHPRDDGGKSLIQELYRFMQEEGVRHRMVFIEDYDMDVARALVQGVDVWLNNPRRPYEASGTSGMKVIPNGGLNCSILDGWWDEGYNPEVGWAIGDRRDVGDHGQQDWLDSHALYHLIEAEIAPKFYHRANGSAPTAWVQMVKASMAQLGHVFSTHRMVRDYAQTFYEPSWDMYHALTENGLERAKAALAWRDRIRKEFPKVAIRRVQHNAQASNQVQTAISIQADIDLGALSPAEIRVEAVFGRVGPNRELHRESVIVLDPVEGQPNHYRADITLTESGHRGFAVRVVPQHADVSIPGELNVVTWESGAL